MTLCVLHDKHAIPVTNTCSLQVTAKTKCNQWSKHLNYLHCHYLVQNVDPAVEEVLDLYNVQVTTQVM